MACDILSIPINSVASESTFNAGGRVIDPYCASLSTETVQMLLCEDDWKPLRLGNLLTWDSKGFISVIKTNSWPTFTRASEENTRTSKREKERERERDCEQYRRRHQSRWSSCNRVTSIKIDPYLNTDAGTMSPFEHGEVFALDDGGKDHQNILDKKLDMKNPSNNEGTVGIAGEGIIVTFRTFREHLFPVLGVRSH
ncbi:uncharacterized protein LOC130755510 [Actinidia eriantha]|uniref:uncharacterized protein LOC130755510 n=1 Tax=Actinidia eriantha TaxID=165200 RepID=UPI0025871B13|nr:uncharacterized protein LOC130755510 [Actinidia eriantha]